MGMQVQAEEEVGKRAAVHRLSRLFLEKLQRSRLPDPRAVSKAILAAVGQGQHLRCSSSLIPAVQCLNVTITSMPDNTVRLLVGHKGPIMTNSKQTCSVLKNMLITIIPVNPADVRH